MMEQGMFLIGQLKWSIERNNRGVAAGSFLREKK
jgi:hypothetical protein